ncbi:MAG: hydrogenase [Campylobacterota bacterium]|nr:hydrogenase [Campylobacterota bacterium]
MALKQTIEYNSSNRYFAGFLQNIINESGVNASVSQSSNNIELIVDDSDEKALLKFSEQSQTNLPQSIFLGDINTASVDACIEKSGFTSPAYNIALCPKCLDNLTNPSSLRYLDDTIVCNHYSNSASSFSDNTIFSPHFSDGSSLLLSDPLKIDELFIMTNDEKKALFSIEKPLVKVTIKDETLKNLVNKSYIFIKSPDSIRSTLVALNAKESGVSYLFFNSMSDLKAVVVQNSITIIEDKKGLSTTLEKFDDDALLNRFLNIKKEANFDRALALNLTIDENISFLLSDEYDSKKIIEFQQFVLKDVVEQMKSSDIQNRLLMNFHEKYEKVVNELSKNGNYTIFETICTILELDGRSFETLSDASLDFHGNGGLKIDTNFISEGFDYSSFLGSIISFKLAEVDKHYLAYSIFEALADMSITTLNQLKSKYSIDNFIMMGNIFENSVLYSRILSKFQLSNPYFSKSFAIN